MNRFLAVGIVVILLSDGLLLPGINGQEVSQDRTTNAEKAAAKLDPSVVRKLITELQSADFKTRDKATQELSKLDELPDALREAAKSANTELRRRAQVALDRITLRLDEKAYQALIAELHKIEIDRFVRRMVTDEKFAGNAQWKVIQSIARAVTKRANELAGQKFPVPEIDLLSLPLADLARERVALNQKRVLLQHREPRFTSWNHCVILCTGPTPRTTGLSNSILIVDGDFTGATGVDHSLVIVRGNVGRLTGLRGSIVLATGNFVGATSCDNSFLEVNNQRIRFTGSRDSLLVKTALKTTGPTTSRVIDTEKGPLQLLNFSKRKTDAELAWGKQVHGLAVAITPADHQDKILVRWKNVGTDLLEVPWNRFHSNSVHLHADDLLGHVFLKGPDGKLAPARQFEVPRVGGPPSRMNNVVLGPGQMHEETLDLWAYVEKPAAAGRYQLSIELDPEHRGHAWEWEAKFWSGRLESNSLEIMVGK